MKKIIIFFFIVAVSASYPQFIKDYGVKAGGTISNQNWNYTLISPVRGFVPDNKLGLNMGVFAEFFNIPFFRLVTELNYVQKGIQKEIEQSFIENPDGNGKFILWKLGINYLNVSILAKPCLDLEIIKPYLLIGPRIDFELGKSIEYYESSFYNDFEKSRLGLKLGMGTEFKLVGIKLLAEFIYDMDFAELYKNENVKVTSSAFHFRIGIYF